MKERMLWVGLVMGLLVFGMLAVMAVEYGDLSAGDRETYRDALSAWVDEGTVIESAYQDELRQLRKWGADTSAATARYLERGGVWVKSMPTPADVEIESGGYEGAFAMEGEVIELTLDKDHLPVVTASTATGTADITWYYNSGTAQHTGVLEWSDTVAGAMALGIWEGNTTVVGSLVWGVYGPGASGTAQIPTSVAGSLYDAAEGEVYTLGITSLTNPAGDIGNQWP